MLLTPIESHSSPSGSGAVVFTLLSGLSVIDVAKGTNIHLASSTVFVSTTSTTTSAPNSPGDGSCDVPDLKSKSQRGKEE